MKPQEWAARHTASSLWGKRSLGHQDLVLQPRAALALSAVPWNHPD